jgi:hypothetical protein
MAGVLEISEVTNTIEILLMEKEKAYDGSGE